MPVALPLNVTVGSGDCLANGEAIGNALSVVELEGGFLNKCFLSQHQPNPDFLFGWSVWQCQTQLYWCDLLTLLSQGHVTDAANMLGAQFRDAVVTVIGQSNLYPAFAYVVHPQYACLASAGSSTLSQVLVQALNSVQGPQDYGTYSTGNLWYDFSSYLLGILQTQGVLDGRPLMLCGHSYGAASVLGLAARIKVALPAVEIRYITYGCPKPGDLRLSVYLDKAFDGLSLVNDGDFVTALPPSADVIAALSDFLPTAGLTAWTKWQYPPETTLMRGAQLYKNTYQRYDSLGLAIFLAKVALSGTIGTVTPHDITEYGNTIRQRCTRLLPTDVGEVLGMIVQPAILAKPGEVLGMVFEPGPITSICCPSGNPTVRTVTIVSADPPNAFLTGLTWQVTWNPGNAQWEWLGGSGPTTPPTQLKCVGVTGWRLLMDPPYTFANTIPGACGTLTFTSLIDTSFGFSNCTVTVQDGIPPPPTVFSLSFNGSTGYVDCGPTVPSQFALTSPFSISLWVKPSSASSPSEPLTLNDPVHSAGWYVRYGLFGEQSLTLFRNDGTNFVSWRCPNGDVPTGSWTHVVFTDDGSNSDPGRLVYVNGALVTATHFNVGTMGGIPYASAHCEHGRNNDATGYFPGLVCQPAIYSGVLSSTQVTQLFVGGDPSLIGTPTNVWKYGEGSGTTIADAVGTATGTLTGGVFWSTDIPPPL